MRLYFDANVLIEAVEGEGASAEKLGGMLALAEDGGCTIISSELSIAEAIIGPLKRLAVDERDAEAFACERLYRSFADPKGAVEMAPIDQNVLLSAARLRADWPSLKLPDAIHLATAMLADCDVFISGDKRLLTITSKALKRGDVYSLDAHHLGALNVRLGL